MTCHFQLNDVSEFTLATRTPFKVIQVVARNEEDMSTTRKYGLTQYNVPRQSRFSKPFDSCSNKPSARQVDPSNNVNITSTLSKSKTCDKVSALSKVSRKGSPSPESRRNKTSDSKSTAVHSLTASPKWSRIKDKFEASELADKDSPSQNGMTKNSISSRPSTLGISSRYDGLSSTRKTVSTKPSVSFPKPASENKTNTKGKVLSKQDGPTVNTNAYKKSLNVGETITTAVTNRNTALGAKSKISAAERSNSFLTGASVASTLLPNGCLSESRISHTKTNSVPAKFSLKQSNECSSLVQKHNPQDSNPSEPLSKLSQKLESKSAINNLSNVNKRNNFSRNINTSGDGLNTRVKESSGNLLSNVSEKSQNSNKQENDTFLHRYAKNKALNSSNSQNSAKTIWVKDEIGNWVRKPIAGPTNQASKVAVLRNRFNSDSLNTSSHNNALSKSRTVPSVPSTVGIASSRKLVKCNTVSDVLKSSHAQDKSQEQKHGSVHKVSQCLRTPSLSSKSSSASDSSERISPSSDEKSPNQAHRLSIVQRAVLSYEENLSLLSPETQKKLKLLGEKVKAQNEEDLLLEASRKRNNISGESDTLKKTINTERSDFQKKDETKSNQEVKKSEEAVQPVRNFLNRYHNLYKNKQQDKLEAKLSNAITPISNGSVKNTVKEELAVKENVTSDGKVKALAKQFVSQKGSVAGDNTNKVPNGKVLRPNASFLWRNSRATVSEDKPAQQKDKDTDSYHNYYVLENYYSESESTKLVEGSGDVASGNSIKLTAGEARYQNMDKNGKKEEDGWIDLSDEDGTVRSTSSSQSSTLKKKKNRRHSHYKEILNRNCGQNLRNDLGKDTTDNKVLQQDETKTSVHSSDKETPGYYADTQDSNYSDHLYEAVYESLGNYLTSDDNNENEIQSISPDDEQTKEDIYSSFTSLESLHSDKGLNEPINKSVEELNNDNIKKSGKTSKKGTSRIRQLRRHLSWTKSDIKLELSSKFNKIKIKKNGNNRTEIGVRVQENDTTCTSPKKNTFIKCILKQKSCNNMPEKKSPSPKKESALFYVHLSMTQGKQRPFSDSCVDSLSHVKANQDPQVKESRKTSEPIVPSQFPPGRMRKRSSCQVIQRPKTPPPLPPTKIGAKVENTCDEKKKPLTAPCESIKDNSIYSECKFKTSSLDNGYQYRSSLKEGEETYPSYKEFDSKSSGSLYSTIDTITSQTKRNSLASSASYDSYAMQDESGGSSGASSTTYSSAFTLQIESNMPFYSRNIGSHTSNLSLPLIKDFKNDLLKSPFEEEPLYQFYHKDVQQRASMWYSGDGSESEFEDYSLYKEIPKKKEPSDKPVLQTQTSAMDLLRGEGGQRSLWCEVPDVKTSGILENISSQDRKIQEAMFEVITSEASYLKSLNFLLEHFVQCPEFRSDAQEKQIIDKRELHLLFSDVPPVREVSANFLADLEKRWLENIVLSNVCDIIYKHASKNFSVYVKYCSNQLYQERTLKKLKEDRPQFVEVVRKLESNPVCQGLDMHSFLMLPMQRITRLPLLVDAIFHRLDVDSPIYESCKMALVLLNKLVAECNEGARKMVRMEEMLVISHQLDFRDCKGLGLLSASRWLVKKGELVQLVLDNSTKRTFGRNQRWCKIRLFLFLFTDLFVITRKKSDDTYCVVDYCPRNMVQVVLLDENSSQIPARLPTHHQNVFQLIILSNSEGKTVEMLLSCVLESDRTRWIDAVTPPKSDNPDEKIYESWDCPQVQCTHDYVAQQPDELTIEESDVVNVFRKMSDGWFEGERIRDGVRGWFPSSHVMEIVSSHVRARNLRQRYRLLQISQSYVEEQQKAQAGHTHKTK